MIQSLQSSLVDWTDYDGVCFLLARCLGLIDETVDFTTRGKAIVLGDRKLRPVLSKIVETLLDAGILERNDDDQYRWSSKLGSAEAGP